MTLIYYFQTLLIFHQLYCYNMIHVNGKLPTFIEEKLYDNIWLQAHFTKEFTGIYGIIKFDEVLFGNDGRKASLMISDHRPLWAEFEVSADDD